MDKSLVARTANGRDELHDLVCQYAYAPFVTIGKLGEANGHFPGQWLAY